MAQTLPVSFYITKMIPSKDNPNEYEIRGLFAEVWFALQVSLNIEFFFNHCHASYKVTNMNLSTY